MRYSFKTLSVIVFVAVLISMSTVIDVSGQNNTQQGDIELDEIINIRNEIIDYYIEFHEADDINDLVNNALIFGAGTFSTDWIVYSIALTHPNEIVSDEYKNKLIKKISEDYNNGLITSSIPIDYYRIALVLSSLGVNPSQIVNQDDNTNIDLIALSVLENEKALSMINSISWALIVLDCLDYEIPENAELTRDVLVDSILNLQKESKGFSLTGENSDPDITAMAIRALSPYYADEKVNSVINEALSYLSQIQLDSGDYKSWGNRNSQTGAQVMIALSNLGINPTTDERFIKNNTTLLDGLFLYKLEDGSFANTFPANKSDSKATEQALMALLSLEQFFDDSTEPITSEEISEPPIDEDPTNKAFIAVIVVIIAIIIVQILKKRWNQKGEK